MFISGLIEKGTVFNTLIYFLEFSLNAHRLAVNWSLSHRPFAGCTFILHTLFVFPIFVVGFKLPVVQPDVVSDFCWL